MTSRRALGLGIATAVAAAAVALAAPDGAEPRGARAWSGTLERVPLWLEPRIEIETGSALVSANGLTAAASVETHCVRGPKGAYCADAAGGLPQGPPVLPVDRGGAVDVRLAAPARAVRAWIVLPSPGFRMTRLSPTVAAARRAPGGRSWTLAVPDRALPRGAVLRIRVGFRDWRGEPVHFNVPVDDG